MSTPVRVSAVLAMVLMTDTQAAEPDEPLLQVPVANLQRVAAAAHGKASSVARRGGMPVDVALAAAGPFEGSTQHIVQVNQGAEAPSGSRVLVLRDGLLDDAVRSERWEVDLERTAAGPWKVKEVRRAWRCRRGAALGRFDTVPCP